MAKATTSAIPSGNEACTFAQTAVSGTAHSTTWSGESECARSLSRSRSHSSVINSASAISSGRSWVMRLRATARATVATAQPIAGWTPAARNAASSAARMASPGTSLEATITPATPPTRWPTA